MPAMTRTNRYPPPTVSQGGTAPEPTINPTLLGSHPTIANLWASTGRIINSMEVHGGKVYLAYGDYSKNAGPIDVTFYNIAGASFGSELTAPTEEHDTYRKINGKLYIPRKDPNPTPGWDGVGGYATDASGAWVNVAGPNMIHTFDCGSLTGTDMWIVGSAFLPEGERGVAYRTLNGSTWTLERQLGAGDDSRFYASVKLGSSLYLYGMGSLHIFDGSAWTTTPWAGGNQLYVVGGRLFGTNGWLNGSTSTSFGMSFRDIWTDGVNAYGLTSTYHVYKAVLGTGTFTWSEVGLLPQIFPSSIAVSGTDLYVGTSSGALYRAPGAVA